MFKLTGGLHGGALFLVLTGLLLAAAPAGAKTLDFRVLTAQRLDRINDDSKAYYEQTLAHIDRINYIEAMDSMNKAVDAEPDDVYLRQAALSLSMYLGDTRQGASSVKYYEMAMNHLKALSTSARLNKREQDRALELMRIVSELRNAVGERDEKRMLHGREIAKKYARIIYQGETEEREVEKVAKQRIQVPEKQAQEASDASVDRKLQ